MDTIKKYIEDFRETLGFINVPEVHALAELLQSNWRNGARVFICGNGGSAANAMHLANDLLYGIAPGGIGIKAIALVENISIVTCLSNDLGYEKVFSRQLAVQGTSGDILIVLSGSGNSKNIIRVLEQAKVMDINSFAIVGFDGGMCKTLADITIHIPINNMQIAEDTQSVIGHIVTQWLLEKTAK